MGQDLKNIYLLLTAVVIVQNSQNASYKMASPLGKLKMSHELSIPTENVSISIRWRNSIFTKKLSMTLN
jgi:hypothetical protein